MSVKHLLYFIQLLSCSRLSVELSNVALWEDKEGKCVSESTREIIHSEIKGALTNRIVPHPTGLFRHLPANSCADIYEGHPSGHYWLSGAHGPQLVYCSLNENRCCNDSHGKWMRVTFLNMSDPSAQCPDGWREVESPIRTCRRKYNTSVSSVNYTTYGIPYSRVCGRIKAYQFGIPEAFGAFKNQNKTTLDDTYVDGISITYGQQPRKHIWTLVAARGTSDDYNCPCTANRNITTPPFIHIDYFCERETEFRDSISFVTNNPLWDGHGCTGSSTCCEFNNPPWFCKQLPEPTTEDIEIRIIGSVIESDRHDVLYRRENEDTPVELIEILVQ